MTNQCEYCTQAKPLVTGNSDDKGISLMYPNILSAYGYDIHGSGSNGLCVKINYCPMCGAKMSGGGEDEESSIHIPIGATNGDMIKTLFPSAEFELNSDWKKTNTGYLTFKGNGFSMCVYLEWWYAPYKGGKK